MAKPVAHIFNLSLVTWSIPIVWCCLVLNHVLSIFKGGDASEVDNCRPIPSKSTTMHFFYPWIIFLPPISLDVDQSIVLSAASAVTNYIINGIGKGQKCVALFIDLFKAFDTVDHWTLLRKIVIDLDLDH